MTSFNTEPLKSEPPLIYSSKPKTGNKKTPPNAKENKTSVAAHKTEALQTKTSPAPPSDKLITKAKKRPNYDSSQRG